MRIGLDMMGGDFAPAETVKGALQSHRELQGEVKLVLIGKEDVIKSQLKAHGGHPADFEIVHAGEVIEMGENPVKAIQQKTDSSIVKGLALIKGGKIDAFASAGNTGAVLVSSLYTVKTVPGITRPAVFSVLPKEDGHFGILLDVGANADAKPENLQQFALLGHLYARHVLGIEQPRVGLLNIGEEEGKGNLLTQSAYKLIKATNKLHFIGNVEGRDLFNNKADVIVSDGFTGNIVLKAAEALISMIQRQQKDAKALEKFNYETYGGTPVLGVNAPVIIGHGISKARAITNMVKLTKNILQTDLIATIKQTFNK